MTEHKALAALDKKLEAENRALVEENRQLREAIQEHSSALYDYEETLDAYEADRPSGQPATAGVWAVHLLKGCLRLEGTELQRVMKLCLRLGMAELQMAELFAAAGRSRLDAVMKVFERELAACGLKP